MNPDEVPRMSPQSDQTSPTTGKVIWSPVKSLWFTAHLLVAVIGGYLTFRTGAVVLSFVFTVATLCLGHTLGLHRLLVHRSFACPRWLEYMLVHLGTVVGMGGPFRILYLHDIRDWAQRHESCHPFFIHQNPLWKDFLWQLHCEIRLANPPRFQIEGAVANDSFHRFLERTWMLQQLPWAVLFYALGGIAWVVWGISVRVTISLIGHWLVGYFAHNSGRRDWHLRGHAVQGHNVPRIGLLTMGESWHNNHHAFPGSARLGLTSAQPDPGWWALRTLQSLGLAWGIKLPADLPVRPELLALNITAGQAARLPVDTTVLNRQSSPTHA
jgi:stearoyl-CoA desaturase (delta-9 desaturase)